MKKELIEKYAELVVKTGVNVQKNQLVVINANIVAKEFVEELTEKAYLAGASKVKVNWSDEALQKMKFQYQSNETISDIRDYLYAEALDDNERGACFIHVLSDNPDNLKDVDSAKVALQMSSYFKNPLASKIMNYTMANINQWCVVGYPSNEWAQKVFPNETAKNANNLLSKAILKTARITSRNNPVKELEKHNRKLHANFVKMNKLNFKSLHYTNSLGTDIEIGLPKHHVWAGGAELSQSGIKYAPNIPSEEIFTAPDKLQVNGIVYASMPLAYNGSVIKDLWIKVKDGKIIDFGAKENQNVLAKLLDTDSGSHYLGEVALVPYDSPISNSGILFFNTLYDENASCHLAIGRGYPMCIKNGEKMTEEECENAGVNFSNTHVDFMVGTKDLQIIGTKYDGQKVTVFKEGNFAI